MIQRRVLKPKEQSLSDKWPAPAWVREAIFYEIFPERFANGDPSNDPPGSVPWGSDPTRDNFFGGDLQGVLDRLPYLEDLGITALYLTPIFKAGSNHKYDTHDYLEIDPAFGDKDLLRRLVCEAHKRGIRIVLDAVFNHCGTGFWAFEDVLRFGPMSKYASWFFINSYPLRQQPPSYQTFGAVPELPKFNTWDPEVREYLFKVATYWIEAFDIDGWRLDVPWKVPMEFWQGFREKVKHANPEAYIVGEMWRDPTPWLRGDTFDGVMNYLLREVILDYCVREKMDAEDFDYELLHLLGLHGDSAPYQLNLLGSHDTPRLLTLCDGDLNRAIIAVVFLFTFIGCPLIYYGDEVGLTGGQDPGCRRAMPWDQACWQSELVQTYRLLIQARRRHPALRGGQFERLWVFNNMYAYRRWFERDEVIVILNPREKLLDVRVPCPGTRRSRQWRDLIQGGGLMEQDGFITLEVLPAKTAYVLIPDSWA